MTSEASLAILSGPTHLEDYLHNTVFAGNELINGWVWSRPRHQIRRVLAEAEILGTTTQEDADLGFQSSWRFDAEIMCEVYDDES